jgi:hypothetical protein
VGEDCLADRSEKPWCLAHPAATNNDEPCIIPLCDADDHIGGRSIIEDHIDDDLARFACSPTRCENEPADIWSSPVAALLEQPDAVHDDEPRAQSSDECQRPVERGE